MKRNDERNQVEMRLRGVILRFFVALSFLGLQEKLGAQMEFGAKYPEIVSVYFVEDKNGSPFSKEFCGGPHVTNTNELGHFKIQKEEAVSQGIRRIKGILE